jgi:hypothetical protein
MMAQIAALKTMVLAEEGHLISATELAGNSEKGISA